MSAVRVPRWAMSLADLSLLLLGLFVILYVSKGHVGDIAASTRAALHAPPGRPTAGLDRLAANLFEPGEARLKPRARAELIHIGRQAARAKQNVRVESRGQDGDSRRFDGWELSAARAAAAARAIQQGGVPAEHIEIVVPTSQPEGSNEPNRLIVRMAG